MDSAQAFENHKVAFTAHLQNVSMAMKEAAKCADTFHAYVSNMTYTPGATLPPLPGTLMSPTIPAASGPGRKRKTDLVDDGRKRRKRDPEAPKRPPSAYLFFQNEIRGSVKAAHPFKPHHELLGMISQQWNGMSDQEKKPYEEKQKAAKAVYDREMDIYNVARGIVPKPKPEPKGAAAKAAAAIKAAAVVEPPVAAGASDDSSEVSEEEEPSVEEEDEEEEQDEEEDEEPAPPPPEKKAPSKPASKAHSTQSTTPAKGKKDTKKTKA